MRIGPSGCSLDAHGKGLTSDDVLFWAFDLLEQDGKDLRELPLTARKG